MSRFGRMFAVAVAVERIHSIGYTLSPRYQIWYKTMVRAVNRKLRLNGNSVDIVCDFLGIENSVTLDGLETWSCGFDRSQQACIDRFLFENIEFVGAIEMQMDAASKSPTDLGSIMKHGGTDGVEILTDAKKFSYKRPASPDEILQNFVEHRGPADYIASQQCLDVQGFILAKVNGTPVVFYDHPQAPYPVLEVAVHERDQKKLEGFFSSLLNIVQGETEYKGLIVEANISRSIQEARAVSNERPISWMPFAVVGSTSSASLDMAVDYNLSATLRYRDGRHVKMELYNQEVRNMITKDILRFVSMMPETDDGAVRRRSYLLVGPPGSGKSTLIKDVIRSLPDNFVTVMVNRESFEALHELRFKSYLWPMLVVIEDIDLLLDENSTRQQFLNFLDGLTSPARMITVMTTNHMDRVIGEIKDRPGRVDRIVHVLSGDDAARLAQMKSLLGAIQCEIDLEEIVPQTKEMTVAQLKEVIQRAILYTDSFAGIISGAALKEVLSEMNTNRVLTVS